MNARQWPAPGVHYGVSERDYHAISWKQRVVSKSVLWAFAPNPYTWKFGPEKAPTAAMDWGSLVDCLFLTPDAFLADFVILPFDNYKKQEARDWRDRQTKTVITDADLDAANEAKRALENHTLAKKFRNGAQTQVSVMHALADETGDVWRAKCRLDIVPTDPDWLCDLKTTGKPLNSIPNIIADRGYHAQAAFYMDLWNAATGEDRTRWAFIFQSDTPPYEVAVVELDREGIEAGRKWYREAFAKWCRCTREGNFPSPWEDEIKVVTLPKWAQTKDNEE